MLRWRIGAPQHMQERRKGTTITVLRLTRLLWLLQARLYSHNPDPTMWRAALELT